MSDQSTDLTSASIAAASPAPTPASAPKEQPSEGDPAPKEPEADHAKVKSNEEKPTDKKK